MKKIVVVCSNKEEKCPDTARVLAYLFLRLGRAKVELLRQDSPGAKEIQALAKVFVGERLGYPLVCMVKQNTMTAADVEPSSEMLAAMLETSGYNTAPLTDGQGKFLLLNCITV